MLLGIVEELENIVADDDTGLAGKNVLAGRHVVGSLLGLKAVEKG